MNIINIDSEILPTVSQIAFCEEVLSFGEDHHHFEEDSLLALSKRLPIFLVSPATFARAKIESIEEGEEGKPSTEWLGYYTRSTNNFMDNTPVIVLCLERIRQCTTTDDEYTIIFAKVLIHELAHAKMDFDNENSTYGKYDEFYKWMEESFANMITLEVFENYERGYSYIRRNQKSFSSVADSFNMVKNFILRQPANYCLGWTLFDKRISYWSTWRNHKDDLGIKATPQKEQEKQDYLDYMKKNYRNLDEDRANFLFDCVFYGTSETISKNAKRKLEDKIRNDSPITQKDLKNVTDMRSLFYGVKKLSSDISKWDVSKVTDMGYMFRDSTINPDISGWDVSNVTDMAKMFYDANFTHDLSGWDISKVKNMSSFMADVDSKQDFFKKYPKKLAGKATKVKVVK